MPTSQPNQSDKINSIKQESTSSPENIIELDGLDVDRSSFWETVLTAWQSILGLLKHNYLTTADKLVDEILIKLSQKQINDALNRFVVQNVDMMLDLHMTLHDDWLRLYCTVNVKGIFASVACNFRLVQAQLDSATQRFVFEQLSDTEILQLHSKKWWQASLAKLVVKLYRHILRKDPLPFLLHKIIVKGEPFASYKGNVIYLDIHRYLAKQHKILNILKKVQVNDGDTQTEKLLLKLQVNFAELLSLGDSGEDIITERDNPERKKTAVEKTDTTKTN